MLVVMLFFFNAMAKDPVSFFLNWEKENTQSVSKRTDTLSLNFQRSKEFVEVLLSSQNVSKLAVLGYHTRSENAAWILRQSRSHTRM